MTESESKISRAVEAIGKLNLGEMRETLAIVNARWLFDDEPTDSGFDPPDEVSSDPEDKRSPLTKLLSDYMDAARIRLEQDCLKSFEEHHVAQTDALDAENTRLRTERDGLREALRLGREDDERLKRRIERLRAALRELAHHYLRARGEHYGNCPGCPAAKRRDELLSAALAADG